MRWQVYQPNEKKTQKMKQNIGNTEESMAVHHHDYFYP